VASSAVQMGERSKRGVGFGVSALLLSGACWAVVVACGSDDERTGFTPDDAATDVTTQPTLDGTFGMNDSGGGCQPVAPTKPLATKPTKQFAPSSCTATQVAGYVKDCLQSDGNVCDAYKTANAACVACVESVSSDASWGPIVFYENRQYYDYNYGGCIANVTNDFSATGCGAAETRYLECRHAACVTCLPPGFPRDYKPFYECQNKSATDTLCATELSDVRTSCAAYFAGSPMDACQAGGLSSDDYLRKLITGFCGGADSDAGDAGDGGDGG
jgi:hypothetical protein